MGKYELKIKILRHQRESKKNQRRIKEDSKKIQGKTKNKIRKIRKVSSATYIYDVVLNKDYKRPLFIPPIVADIFVLTEITRIFSSPQCFSMQMIGVHI